MNNQQQSPDEGNVQRLERKLVPLAGETGSNHDVVEDIVHNDKWESKKIGKSEFLVRAAEKYGDAFTYDLSNYTGLTKNKIRIHCATHGWFEQVPHTFLLGNCRTGCRRCGFRQRNQSKTKTYTDFLLEARKRHGDVYQYPEESSAGYKNRKSKITITCLKHGKFIKSAQKHLAGQGCYECGVARLVSDGVLVGGYSDQLFKDKPELKTRPAHLYYFSINNGEYYKIGITTRLLKRAIGVKSKSMGDVKSVDLLWAVSGSLYDCFLKEQEILHLFKERRVFRVWSSELFDSNVLPLSVLHIPTSSTLATPWGGR